ncbi:protein Flattop isoform 1-T2 [Odontesthes bonariensis]|uniref:protein Flattop n=1 Tax=Odontesthes bonariensis TaxID=219752 RepID=UPI003F585809
MSSGFSANQFEGAFKSQRLLNWCEPKHFKERPTGQVGHTSFIADNRGHLLPGVVKTGSAWSDFKGTWDLPARIPSRHINPTARSVDGLKRLKSWGMCPQQSGKSLPHRGSSSTDRPRDDGEQTREDAQQDGAAPAPQSRPATWSETAATKSRDSQRHGAESPAEQATRATGKDRPLSQGSSHEGKPAPTASAGKGTHTTPETGEGRHASEKAAPPSPSQTTDVQQ